MRAAEVRTPAFPLAGILKGNFSVRGCYSPAASIYCKQLRSNKGTTMRAKSILASVIILALASRAALGADEMKFAITIDAVENGTLNIQPPLPEDRQVPAGTELTLK